MRSRACGGSTTAARRELEVAMAAARILVVGAGIAGLATARALAGAGFSVEVVEREGALGRSGRGHLPARERGPRPPHAWARASGVGASGRDPTPAFQRPPRPAARRGRSRGDVGRRRTLPRAPSRRSPCRSDRRGARRADPDGSPRCADSASTTGRSQSSLAMQARGEYDLAVGADGIHSTVRRLAFGNEATARPVGQVGWRFVAACPSERSRRGR